MFRYLITFVGLALAGCAAFFSVKGLSQLFIGGGIIITIMASILEGAKILTVSILERYWKTLSTLLKTYLITAVVVLMVITSAGIYGLLANGYQATFNELDKNNLVNNSIEEKIGFINDNVQTLTLSIDEKSKENKSLRDEKDNLYQMLGNNPTNSQRRNIERKLKDIDIKQNKNKESIDDLNGKITNLRDSINTLNVSIIDNKVNKNLGSEIGSLIYLSELTGKPMNVIVNYMILLIIFIFDPLAVTLIIVANKLRNDKKEEEVLPKPKEIVEPEVKRVQDVVIEEPKVSKYSIEETIEEPIVEIKEEPKKKSAKEIITNEENNRKFSVKIPNKQTANGGGNNTISRI